MNFTIECEDVAEAIGSLGPWAVYLVGADGRKHFVERYRTLRLAEAAVKSMGQAALSPDQPLPLAASRWAVELEALPEGYADRECWALYEVRPDGSRRRHERYTTKKQADYLAAYFTENPPKPRVPPIPPTAFRVFIDRLKLVGMLFILIGLPIFVAIWSGGSRGDRYYDDDIPGYWRPSR